jgi:hypothetical protein
MKNPDTKIIIRAVCTAVPLAAVAASIPHLIRRRRIRKYALQ